MSLEDRKKDLRSAVQTYLTTNSPKETKLTMLNHFFNIDGNKKSNYRVNGLKGTVDTHFDLFERYRQIWQALETYHGYLPSTKKSDLVAALTKSQQIFHDEMSNEHNRVIKESESINRTITALEKELQAVNRLNEKITIQLDKANERDRLHAETLHTNSQTIHSSNANEMIKKLEMQSAVLNNKIGVLQSVQHKVSRNLSKYTTYLSGGQGHIESAKIGMDIRNEKDQIKQNIGSLNEAIETKIKPLVKQKYGDIAKNVYEESLVKSQKAKLTVLVRSLGEYRPKRNMGQGARKRACAIALQQLIQATIDKEGLTAEDIEVIQLRINSHLGDQDLNNKRFGGRLEAAILKIDSIKDTVTICQQMRDKFVAVDPDFTVPQEIRTAQKEIGANIDMIQTKTGKAIQCLDNGLEQIGKVLEMTEGMNNELLSNHKNEIDSIQDRSVNRLMDSRSNPRQDMFIIEEERNNPIFSIDNQIEIRK